MGIICIFRSKYEKLWFCLQWTIIHCSVSLSRKALILFSFWIIYSLLSFPINFSMFRYTKLSKNKPRKYYFNIFAVFCNYSSRKRHYCLGIHFFLGKTIYRMWIPYIIHYFDYKFTFILKSQVGNLSHVKKNWNIPVILKKMATQNFDIWILDPDFSFKGIRRLSFPTTN